MSSSFVPKIAMSKGVAKHEKFDISSNTHTTSEVGYLQPTFSKLLMPKTDLTIKSNDTVLLSSLVVPTFGELSLRHWYMATPVSSLWSCLGAFLTQESYNDLDSPSGHSIPHQMPKDSIWHMLRALAQSAIYKQSISVSPTGQYSLDTVYCPPELMGNLTYAFRLSGDRMSKDVMTYTQLLQTLLFNSSTNITENKLIDGPFITMTEATMFPLNPVLHQIQYTDNHIKFGYRNASTAASSTLLRYSPFLPWWWTGVVVKNGDDVRRIFTTANDKCDFPTKDICPYVVVFFDSVGGYTFFPNKYDDPTSVMSQTPTRTASLSIVPLTNRMFAGDTDRILYDGGFRNNLVYDEDDNKCYHDNGHSSGWLLQPDDSYFTGDLLADPMDVVSVQGIGTQSSLSTSNAKFFCGVRLSRRYKRLRKLLVGLGFQFSPFSTKPVTPFKFMAYYKGWFDNFYPKRTVQYYQTPLARLVQYLGYHSSTNVDNFLSAVVDWESTGGYNHIVNFSQPYTDFCDILFACADAKYLMPIDYFSLADKDPLNYQNKPDENMNVVTGVNSSGTSDVVSGVVNGANFSSTNAWAVKMADKMLSYLTKKRVVGKSVSDSMRAIFGAVDEHDKAHESTWCFGTHSTPIKISAVMSQAETQEMHLGDYAGRGLGGSTSRTFKIDNNGDLLIVFVMSALVPRLGYYQGISKENTIGSSPNDFCRPKWDAVGYDDVDVTEYIADSTIKNDLRNPDTVPSARSMADFDGKILGLVPRNTWYKTSRDIVNGDMSIPSLEASLSPYVLTRKVPVSFGTDPIEMRTVNPDDFNKIFNESSSLDDHFIIQMGFDVTMFAPLRSISTSFDDFDQDEDGTIEVEHS